MVEQELEVILGSQNSSGTHGGSTPTPPISETQVELSEQDGGNKLPFRSTSSAWDHFEKEGDDAICNYCGEIFACDSANHGTTNLHKHLKDCPYIPYSVVAKKQRTIASGKQCEGDPVTMKLVEFNQENCRAALVKMLIIDGLPFKFVESLGFRDFMSAVQPLFKIPSRKAIVRDCIQLFIKEKVKLKSILSCNLQTVSLTTDTWTSIQNLNYVCVTAHFIDEGWKLQKKILSFGLIADNKGETIGKALEKCLKDWGIVKIGTITVDNASADNKALAYLVRSMSQWNDSTMLNREYMHLRCCAHILNLIVCDGMRELDSSIGKIRASCRYVRSSLARLSSFKRCAEEANLPTNPMPVLDVPTRWSSTYLMLKVAEKFEEAFTRLEFNDSSYVNALDIEGGPPNSDDWNRVRLFMKILKIFYDATLIFSGSLQVTSTTFFHELCLILDKLNEWMQSDDLGLQRMATNMRTKFDKYWDINGNFNYLLLVAVFLDPRYKLEYIDFCLNELYGPDKCTEILIKLKGLIRALFAQYVALYPLPPNASDASGPSLDVTSQSHVNGHDGGGEIIRLEKKFRLLLKRKRAEFKRDELDKYMVEDFENDYDGFDVLRWWKGKTNRYYVLSRMARDILAIPVSTVTSEAAFITEGCVLDPFRSSLHPTMVEALICTQNWLRPNKAVGHSQSQVDEVGEVEIELAAIAGFEDV